MDAASNNNFNLPPEQQAIRDKCFHPSGAFVEFPIEDVETSVCARFEEIVARYPDNWAIVSDAETVTYAELNERANRVARTIIDRLGVEPQAIALLFESKPSLVVAMLAVLKAGKVLVLLDAAAPEEHNRAVVADVQARCLLVEQQTESFGREIAKEDCRLLNIAAIEQVMIASNPGLLISPDALAAVAYTSGSTGKPKGILWTHRNMLHQTMLFTNEFHHCERDRLSYLAAGAATAAMHPFYALLVGAAVLPFDVKRHGSAALIAWLRQTEATVCALSAPLFRSLASSLTGRERVPNLRLLRLSSEAAYQADFDLYRRHFPEHCLLANGVGPSECFLLATYLMDHNSRFDSHEIPIGYACSGKDILLLDESGASLGFDRIGEIAVRSAYLSPGYWHQAALTAERFEPDPLGSTDRLYRTGDLGLRRADGCLIHKGRKDFRAKIRGYGVEVAEVEAVMRRFPGILDAVVVTRPQARSGENRLIAYFVAAEHVALTSTRWRAFLAEKIPEYMIPAVFVQLEKLPLTANGKVDRAALPAPDHGRPNLGTPYVRPESLPHERLAAIWSSVLGIEPIGLLDNFFDLGGDSLLAMRAIAQAQQAFAVEIPLVEFFDAPTISAVAELIQRCPATMTPKPLTGPAPNDPSEPLPLSFGQERLWFLEQLEPDALRYNLVVAFSLSGSLDFGVLESAFNEIIKRHESLRSAFRATDGKPYQVILDRASIDLPVVDISSSANEENGQDAVRAICRDLALRRFDLGRPPLMRVHLARIRQDQHVLILVLHHMICDGWSFDVLGRDLSAAYNALAKRQPLGLASAPASCAEFAMRQRHASQEATRDRQLAYWRDRLAQSSDLQLPTDRPRPKVREGRGARQWFTVSPGITQSLKAISREAGATLFMTLLAGFQTLLSRHAGQKDVSVGFPVAGRADGVLDHTIGFFLNMLVLRADLSGNPKFTELLARVRQRCLEAYAHQDVPFERLVEALRTERDLSRNPLFQVSFTLGSSKTCSLRLEGVQVQELEVDAGTARFDIELYLEEIGDGLHGFIAYSTDLFDGARIERMIGHFKTLLQSIGENPERRIHELPLHNEAERSRLLVDWNETQREYPSDTCIHQCFEEQVERTPEAIALVFEDQQLTYRELNNRANQLAHCLQKLGVGPEVLVGICVERSIEMIVGLLGILKAGGAYVPLDSSYPAERLKFMLEDTGVSVLLTQDGLLRDDPCAAFVPHIRQVRLDRDWEWIGKQSTVNPASNTTADNLAYVIYTSGSTGMPKGVMISHRAMVNHMLWMLETFRLGATDAIVQKTPISFDASVWEVFAPLIAGSRLIVAEPNGHRDSAYLCRLIQERGANVLQVVPSMLRVLLQENEFADCTSLRLVFCGGEALPADLQQKFHARFIKPTLWNLYGPTETTIDATCWECERENPKAPVPIGRPIPNTKVYILDGYLNPVPIGVVGEIYIGGAGVARGYLNRPELTAEKFIYHSFDGEPARRLFRTGDLARYRADGNIEFLGRIDNQVRIRGYRIELGEIESVLAQHAAVSASVVVVGEDFSGDQQLIAYVISQEPKATASELRDYLKAKLPDSMRPGAFVFLDYLPLTPNGKVDRQALPDPDHSQRELTETFVAPRNAVEESIAAVWSEILGPKQIGVHDNFFDLGGHSLKATQVVSRLRVKFGSEIPLRHLFEYPTIAELAAAMVANLSSGEGLGRLLAEVEAMSEEEAEKLSV